MGPVLRKRNVPECSISAASTTTKIRKSHKRKLKSPSHKSKRVNPNSELSLSSSAPNLPPRGINRLPFDCLHHIFGLIPLRNLLSLRPVSRTWNSTVIYICARKKRLTLAPYCPPAPLGKRVFDLLWIDDLSTYLVDRTENVFETVHFSIDQLTSLSTIGLSQLFTSLPELRLHFNSRQFLRPYLAKIVSLFHHLSLSLSANLRVFSFILSSTEPNYFLKKGYVQDTLFKIASNIITTGRLPHLKQLDLCIEGDYGSLLSLFSMLDIDFKSKKHNDTLAKLKRFSLGYSSPCWDTKNTLAKLGPGLVSLSLNCIESTDLATLTSMFDNVKFESSLTHLRLSFLYAQSNHNFIHALCRRFKALKCVQFKTILGGLLPVNFGAVWMQPLTTLKQLSELRLHNFRVTAVNSSLPSVKKLTLAKQNLIEPEAFRANIFCSTLAAQFPNLEELVIVCRPFLGDANENARAREVEQQVRQNLNNFVHLRLPVLDFIAPEWR